MKMHQSRIGCSRIRFRIFVGRRPWGIIALIHERHKATRNKKGEPMKGRVALPCNIRIPGFDSKTNPSQIKAFISKVVLKFHKMETGKNSMAFYGMPFQQIAGNSSYILAVGNGGQMEQQFQQCRQNLAMTSCVWKNRVTRSITRIKNPTGLSR